MPSNKYKFPKLPSKGYVKLSEKRPSPYNYRDLMRDKTFLKCQARARSIGVTIQSIDFEGREIRFRTESQSVKGKYYITVFRLGDLKEEDIIGGKNVGELLRSAKLKIYSNNPAFLYWGVAYWSWRNGWGLYPEYRYPRVRNPRHPYYVGKHPYACLQVFPFIVNKLGSQFKGYFTEKQRESFQEVTDGLLRKIPLKDFELYG